MRVDNSQPIPIKMWLDDIEEGALAQARDLANLPFAYKWIAIMPDTHQGYGMPIGGVMATKDGIIVPNAVGVDIGCGMIAVQTNIAYIDTGTLKSIMGMVRESIPLGFNHHKEPQAWEGFDRAPDIPVIQRELASARKQLGTLGGGNHFIEIQKGNDGNVWLMIHSGSRNFGLKVASEYHNIAKRMCERWHSDIPNLDLAFLPIDTKEGKEYYEAMKFCLEFAEVNRKVMMLQLKSAVWHFAGGVTNQTINVHHNYAAFENHYNQNVLVHRKGATSAKRGEYGIIPGSMGSYSYIVQGRGELESFMSCSHGAGRKMGRKEAKRTLSLKEEQEKMKGIVHGLRSEGDLDEAPGAYKDIDTVMSNQGSLVHIVTKLTPLASIKS